MLRLPFLLLLPALCFSAEITFTPEELEAITGPQGPQGPAGADGATGPQGEPGQDGTVITGLVGVCSADIGGEVFEWSCTAGGFPANTPGFDPVISGGSGYGYDWSGGDCHERPVIVRRITTLGSGTGAGTVREALTAPWDGNTLFIVSEVGGVADFPQTDTGPNIIATTPAGSSCMIFAPFTSDTPLLLYGLRIISKTSYAVFWHVDQIKKYVDVDVHGQAAGDVLTINGADGTVDRVVVLNSMQTGGSDENVEVWKDVRNVSYDQNLNAWAQGPHAFGMLLGGGTATAGPVSMTRNVFALNVGRNALNQFSGLFGNNLIYSAEIRGYETGADIPGDRRFNIEQNLFMKHNTLPDFTRAALVIASTTSGDARFYFLGSANNHGMNGMPAPPTIDNDADPAVLPSDGARYTEAFPAGTNLLEIGASDTEKTEAQDLIISCAGPRPLAPHAVVSEVMDYVASGTGFLRDTDTTAIPAPTIQNSSSSLADMPASPTFANMIAWLEQKNALLMPAGMDCIGT